jgi:hypothetical protein
MELANENIPRINREAAPVLTDLSRGGIIGVSDSSWTILPMGCQT